MADQARFTTTRAEDGTPLTNIDTTTGLEWTIRPVQGKRMSQREAVKACTALDLAGHTDWHLPTLTELESLRDLTRFDPCIDTDAFPDFPASWFWTSDVCAWSSASAWYVLFGDGDVSYDLRDGDGFALAVRRAGQ